MKRLLLVGECEKHLKYLRLFFFLSEQWKGFFLRHLFLNDDLFTAYTRPQT